MTDRDRQTKPQFQFPMDDVFAAAAMAQRIQGRYVKAGYGYGDVQANRDLMMASLTTAPQEITDADRERGVEVRKYFRRILFKMLSGAHISAFEKTIADIIDNETIKTSMEFGVIAALPSICETSTARDTVESRINFARGGYVGIIGDRVEIAVEVLRSVYSQQWCCYFVVGITQDDQVIRWSGTRAPEVGARVTIRGTVKIHDDNKTKLGRVKVTTADTPEEATA